MLLKPCLSPVLSILSRWLVLTSLVLLVSCGAEESEEDSVPLAATFDSLWANVFNGRCGGCHGPGKMSETKGGPDMTSKDAFFTSLVNKKGSDYPEWETFVKNRKDCLALSFIKPSDAAQSLVVGVLDADNAPCTVKSHTEAPQSVPVSTATLAALKEWINQGAKR